jgi:hypothetical protein
MPILNGTVLMAVCHRDVRSTQGYTHPPITAPSSSSEFGGYFLKGGKMGDCTKESMNDGKSGFGKDAGCGI